MQIDGTYGWVLNGRVNQVEDFFLLFLRVSRDLEIVHGPVRPFHLPRCRIEVLGVQIDRRRKIQIRKVLQPVWRQGILVAPFV